MKRHPHRKVLATKIHDMIRGKRETPIEHLTWFPNRIQGEYILVYLTPDLCIELSREDAKKIIADLSYYVDNPI